MFKKIKAEDYVNHLKWLIKFEYSDNELPLKFNDQIVLTYQCGFPDSELFDALIKTLADFWENEIYLTEYTENNISIILESEFWWKSKWFKFLLWLQQYNEIYNYYEEFFDYSNNNLILFSKTNKWCILIAWNEDIWFIGWSNEYMSKFKKYYPDYMSKFKNLKKDWSEFNNITSYINNLEKFMK